MCVYKRTKSEPKVPIYGMTATDNYPGVLWRIVDWVSCIFVVGFAVLFAIGYWVASAVQGNFKWHKECS